MNLTRSLLYKSHPVWLLVIDNFFHAVFLMLLAINNSTFIVVTLLLDRTDGMLARQDWDDDDATGTNVGTAAFEVDVETLTLQPTLKTPSAFDECVAWRVADWPTTRAPAAADRRLAASRCRQRNSYAALALALVKFGFMKTLSRTKGTVGCRNWRADERIVFAC